jgi:hypothetical protein
MILGMCFIVSLTVHHRCLHYRAHVANFMVNLKCPAKKYCMSRNCAGLSYRIQVHYSTPIEHFNVFKLDVLHV